MYIFNAPQIKHMTMYIHDFICHSICIRKIYVRLLKETNTKYILHILSEQSTIHIIIYEITKSLKVFNVNIVIKYLLNCTELSSSHLRSVGRRYNSGVNVSCLLPLEHRIQLCVHSGSFANWITWSLHTHDALLLTVVAASVHHLRIGARDELVFRTAVVLATDPHRGATHETEGRDLWTGS